MNKKTIYPIRLLDILQKTDLDKTGLSQTERTTLSALITYVSKNILETSGVYESYPSGELLIARTGLKLRTIEGNRKTLQEKGFIKIQTGKGKGNANHYFIDATKIVNLYVANGGKLDAGECVPKEGAYAVLAPTGSTIDRNTQGLKQGKEVPKPKEPARNVDPWGDPIEDDLEEPF